MRGVYIAGTWCFIVNIYFVSPQDPPVTDKGPFVDALVDQAKLNLQKEEANAAPSEDPYTYVAMIDIQFVDDSYKICSGAVLLNHVVLTAAHCFIKQGSNPELTFSFVTVGTEKMYTTGYELFFPIERFKNHPRFKGWTADLALVFTYDLKIHQNPVKNLLLAGEKLQNPLDTTITVLSWGSFSSTKTGRPKKILYQEERDDTETKGSDNKRIIFDVKKHKGLKPARKSEIQTLPSQQLKPYLRGIVDSSPQSVESEVDGVTLHFRVNKDIANATTGRIREEYNITARPKNFRRHHDKKELYSEVFILMDLHKCRQLIEAAKMKEVFVLSDHDDYICFSSKNKFVTEEDIGAPVLRYGRLYGITVGGVQTADDEYVAVGMRIPCFCSWIAKNLPFGGDKLDLECCKDCCLPLVTSPRPLPREVIPFEAK